MSLVTLTPLVIRVVLLQKSRFVQSFFPPTVTQKSSYYGQCLRVPSEHVEKRHGCHPLKITRNKYQIFVTYSWGKKGLNKTRFLK